MNSITNTLFIGKVLIGLKETASTNVYAQELIATTLPAEGTAILADAQRHGKGQPGNTWQSEPGKNITASVILYPTFLAPSDFFLLNESASLAVKDTCAAFIAGLVKVKWPNDILYLPEDGGKPKKMAGILIENTMDSAKIKSSVIGIGLNVNQQDFGAALPDAASMAMINGAEMDKQQVLASLLRNLERRYLQLRAGRHEEIYDEYIHSLYRYNTWGTYTTHLSDASGTQFTGRITGISRHGKLIMETADGVMEFGFKEVGLGR